MGNRKSGGGGGGVLRDSLAVGLVSVSLPTCTGLCDFHIVNFRSRRRWCQICPPLLKKDGGPRVYWSVLKKHPSPDYCVKQRPTNM